MTTALPMPVTPTAALPAWSSVLAVVAHPDDESFGLGAVLDAFVRAGSAVRVLSLTRGEASTVHEIEGDLATLRAAELRAAAEALGVTAAVLGDHPDGALAAVGDRLVQEIRDELTNAPVEGLLVFDPSGVTGHEDHSAATAAALSAAESLGLPVLGWTLPAAVASLLNAELGTSFVGHESVDLVVPVDRERQRIASLAHASQAAPTSVLWRRLEVLGDVEHLRWLRHPQPPEGKEQPMSEAERIRVDWRSGDQFAIAIRDHVVTVDQPEDAGGEDAGPTPTELFVAGLVSCVAFYARRYLRRHDLDATGLTVTATWELALKPARVGRVDIHIEAPDGLPDDRRDALLAVASHCTVHNSITQAPEITVDLN